MKQRSAIGILGGMGPEASVYMYKTLIELSHKQFQAKHNDDFPEIILHSVPVPDFIANDKEKTKALKMLKERVIRMNQLDIAYVSIACNTAHLLLDELQDVSDAPFVSMIDQVVRAVKADNLQAVGILATPSTIRTGLYQQSLLNYGIKSILPNDAERVVLEEVIRNVIQGTVTNRDTKALVAIAESLYQQGAQGIILGCTELPLAFPQAYNTIPVYNSVEILALALLRKYYK